MIFTKTQSAVPLPYAAVIRQQEKTVLDECLHHSVGLADLIEQFLSMSSGIFNYMQEMYDDYHSPGLSSL